MKALVLSSLLADSEGVELVIGVRRGSGASPIDGHAWVRVGGREFGLQGPSEASGEEYVTMTALPFSAPVARILPTRSTKNPQEEPMAGIYKKVEIVGLSEVSFAEAVKVAVEEAGKTIRHMSWFEVVEQRGRIHDGKVAEFQVTIRIGFKLER